MKNNKKKKLTWIIASIVVIVIIFLAVAKKNNWIGETDSIKVSTEIVELRTIVETVSANGKIQPEVEVIVNPDASGEIIDIYVKEGDDVEEGDLLAKINPDIYQSNFDRMAAALNTQKANLANSKARFSQVKAQFINSEASFKRSKKLWNQKVISDSEYDAAKASYDVAKAEVTAAKQNIIASEFQVKSSEAAVKEASDNLRKTTVYASMNGTISKLSKEKGERVAGASQFSAGTEILRIANLNAMEVNVNVSENDIVRVNVNDTAIIEVDAFQDRKFKGIVTEIANSAEISGISADQVTNFAVKIRILQNSYKDLIQKDKPNISPFRPGMSATVDIQTETSFDILTIPIQAVTTRSDSTGETEYKDEKDKDKGKKKDDKKKKLTDEEKTIEYVFAYVKGKTKMIEVETGIQNDNYIQIKKGLKENDEIIVAPYRAINKKLKNNQDVKKVDKDKLFDKDE